MDFSTQPKKAKTRREQFAERVAANLSTDLATARTSLDLALQATEKALEAAKAVVLLHDDAKVQATSTFLLGFFLGQVSKKLGRGGADALALANVIDQLKKELYDGQ